ncbi:MAG: glycerol-3-phosphate responsive antiterminator [Lachnospiraceae bacterium]|uniref:Glycerol-3-phosphate responsive antiterminator n=1 Tax=Candidatus Weimeria bifida TaxID=2599074 RepID=A0A6N7IXQ5_9FIRM|nr:glycerol-3-phosphate responsive antiterminator [Candidatus Weimeria bifida]RRF95566.1 MAG: glycerol-3-phosphate responsive antiterminator [Lachnospiraceae bacterium]
MDHREFIDRISADPIITAAKSDEGLEKSFKADSEAVFILYGEVATIPGIVKKIKEHNKIAMVHIDLINGLSSKTAAVDFIRRYTDADGIITTKVPLMQYARKLGLNTVLRYFVLDSIALDNIKKQSQPGMVQSDIIEILPGVILPSVIKQIDEISRVPIMAGGLIRTKDEVLSALNGGAVAISTTNEKVWFL